MIVDLFLVYQFVRRLATPFTSWDAYTLGIIDEKGTIIIKRKDLLTREQRQAFGIFDLMVLNMKKLLGTLPGGSTRIASYAAALFLIRECKAFTNESILTESDELLESTILRFSECYSDYIHSGESVKEDMSAGAGGIAGIGIGPDGEPGLTKKQQSKHKKRAQTVENYANSIGGQGIVGLDIGYESDDLKPNQQKRHAEIDRKKELKRFAKFHAIMKQHVLGNVQISQKEPGPRINHRHTVSERFVTEILNQEEADPLKDHGVRRTVKRPKKPIVPIA